MSNNIKQYLSITVILFIIIIDILSKNWIIRNIELYDTKQIFSILNFFHIHNYGAIFSLFSNEKGWQRWFLSIISLLIILIIVRTMKKLKTQEINQILAYSLMIGGAIGNLIDRIFYGFVIDFIDFHINNWHFAIFNIADCSIFLGIVIFLKINYKT
ncbi:signal peptidase II [Buchnera aphidicola (Macrosiphoniella sanborni)]|uniref:Lipoprotein signal peptidase n=1 Tax=Buchnera aphidicola (Macrosiphoniella sanborni) TaxID=1241865 RepID=A0A4D6Y525_9GAMM|nr:signal peptidase II [Buchnera aphidicola]QCI23703.1 signal peptidase II [Buchnera aphidicola (Macrosiphoniella sanborni)]